MKKQGKAPILTLLKPLPDVRLDRERAALLIIDMQYLDAHPDYGLIARAKGCDLPEETYGYYSDRLALIIANIQKLLAAFRERGMEVIYTKIQSLTPDGRDRGLQHKGRDIEAKPGSLEAEILPELKPLEGEIVLTKTASGAFNCTAIDYVLRNLGITQLVIVGVVTNGCVETTVRDASDRGYQVILVEDGCAALTSAAHQASINNLSEHYAKVLSTEEVLDNLKYMGSV
ncbi:MAG: cysteine hydrolase [Chloroflexi bacterium]|nr:cysteine hydrolase [Chloroflexota bacterium]MCL5074096.1 cysteine hydrolase [Chloroflexota bacterium]